jgi:hypothetical protein
MMPARDAGNIILDKDKVLRYVHCEMIGHTFMRWNATDERYNEALRRLAVVLLMLAGIAEGIGSRSSPVRSLLLWMQSRAERRVRGFAGRIGALPVPVGYPVHPLGRYGANPANVRNGSASRISQQHGEAVRLVSSFRALAAMFFALARQAPQWLRIARRHGSVRLLNSGREAARLEWGSGPHRRTYADTS